MGDRIAQAKFCKYLTTDDDTADGERIGGFGSTGV
jgi:dUTP pyrophosphatase